MIRNITKIWLYDLKRYETSLGRKSVTELTWRC